MPTYSETYNDAYGQDVPAYEAPPSASYSNVYSDEYSGGGAVAAPDTLYDTYGPSPSQYAAMSSVGKPAGYSPPEVTNPVLNATMGAGSGMSNSLASFLQTSGGSVRSPSATLNTSQQSRGSITQQGTSLGANPQNRATVSTRVSTKPMPTFKMPTYDEGAIKKARQKKMGPMTRELRMAVQTALSKSYENPAVRNQAVEAALRGYGIGLEKASMGAEAAAQQEYNQQFAREMQSSQAAFTNAMNAWQGGQINVSTSAPFSVSNQSDLDKIKTMFA